MDTRVVTQKPSFLQRLLQSVSAPRRGAVNRAEIRSARHAVTLCHALLSERGEVSGARLAREALARYQALEGTALDIFFDLLVKEFSPDPEEVGRCADAYRHEPCQANLVRLLRVAEPPRQELFRRLNMAPGGTPVLVEMRRRLLRDLPDHPQWQGIETDLLHLLSSWFNRGFLVLQRIDWRTSALVLEKLIHYEAVHEIRGWNDLHRRLDADRRCYAFFHPALPDEPLIFIEVALTKGMASRVQPLLDPNSPIVDPATADCAIFYSITNCQEGLRGVSFGNFLIKQVAEDLGREFPRVKTFATLSPIPGFKRWLADETAARAGQPEHETLASMLARLDNLAWFKEPKVFGEIEQQLTRLGAHYLLNAKRHGDPLDPVERFHLGNGARLERLNWLADTSPNGLRRSAGMMVNYVYRIAEVERNHEAYAHDHKVIAARRLEDLAKEALLTAAVPAAAKA